MKEILRIIKLICLFIFLTLVLNIVYADCPCDIGCEPYDPDDSFCNLGGEDDPDYYKENYDPNNADQYNWNNGIPPEATPADISEYYDDIPEDQRGDITSEQMSELEDEDLDFDNMNPEELQTHLNNKYPNVDIIPESGMELTDGELTYNGNNVDIISLPEDSKVVIEDGKIIINGKKYKNAQNIHGNEDGSVSTDSAEHIQTNGMGIWNGNHVTIHLNGDVYIKYADYIYSGTTSAYYVNEYNQKGTEFYVGDASEVDIHTCMRFWNVTETTFNLNSNNVSLSTKNAINITDCKDTQLSITGDGKVTIENDGTYTIENMAITFGDESFVSENLAKLNNIGSETGFSCMSIEASGTYYKNYDDIRKDFAIHISQDSYELCLRKRPLDGISIPNTESNYGVVDFINNQIYLNGQAQYLRYPFRETVTSVIFKNVYDGKEPNARAVINLDNQSLFIDKLDLMYIGISPLVAIVNPIEYLTLYEGDISMMTLSDENQANNLIKEYFFSLKQQAFTNNNIYRRGNLEVHPFNQDIQNNINNLVGSIGNCLETRPENMSVCLKRIGEAFK